MAFNTRVFDLFYKKLGPTGSSGASSNYLNTAWWYSSSTSPRVSGGFLNYPTDTDTDVYITTRDSASNRGYRALPWGSHATDFLWNVTTPSWSKTEPSNVVTWSLSLNNTSSFNRRSLTGGTNYGVSTYPITSSWFIFDQKFVNGNFYYEGNVANTYVGNYQPFPFENSSNYAYDVNFPNLSSNAISLIDNQYFDVGGGAAITRTNISRSLVTMSISSSNNTATGLRHMTEALKARRLFFPIPVSGSGTTSGTDYWFNQFTGTTATEIFNDNGGIYNVQLILKRYTSGIYDSSPDTGSFMTAFIHNVIPQIPSSSQRIAGADGWYPPENNIVYIGHGWNNGPQMVFNDPQSGYLIEKFNFNLVQYGYPAQLCLEVSGSLATNAYFGVIVDDVQICKVGVTSDPRFIKPTNTVQTIVNNKKIFNKGTDNSDQSQPPNPSS